MLNIHEKVNVIPIISKADMLTEKEKTRVKQRINDSVKEHGIKVNHFFYTIILTFLRHIFQVKYKICKSIYKKNIQKNTAFF